MICFSSDAPEEYVDARVEAHGSEYLKYVIDAMCWKFIPRDVFPLGGRTYADRVDIVGVSITVAIVTVTAAVSRSPNKNVALSISAFRCAIKKCFYCEFGWTVNSSSVIIRTPASGIDIHIILVVP